MGRILNYDLLDDFLKDLLDRDIKQLFYTMRPVQVQNATSSIITLTALTDDDRIYLNYAESAATIIPNEKTTQADIDQFHAKAEKRLSEIIAFFHKEHPEARLMVGFCKPLGMNDGKS